MFDRDCHSIGISGHCALDCPVFLYGKCEEEEAMLGVDNMSTIGNIIEYARSQGDDPVEAIYDYYFERGSMGKISYQQAQNIVEWHDNKERPPAYVNHD